MENAVNASTAGSGGPIVIAGAGYAGLHVALRLTARLRSHPDVESTLVNRHGYHQTITELPRVAGGTRATDAVHIPLQDVLAERETTESHVLLAARAARSGRLVNVEAAGGWDDFAYLNAVDVGRDGGAGRQRRGSGRPHRARSDDV